MQEAVRKDVERAFGVLQVRFGIVRGPARSWNEKDLHAIMKACIILHNMIIEDEREVQGLENIYDGAPRDVSISRDRLIDFDFESFVARYREVRNEGVHYQLRNDLVEHLWQRYGQIVD